MKSKHSFSILITSFLPPLLIGSVSSFLIGDIAKRLYPLLEKPPFSPPAFLFPIAWIILYLLMGLATYYMLLSVTSDENKQMALMIYTAQLLVNFLWPIVFFMLQLYGLAAFILCFLFFLVSINIIVYSRINRYSGILLIPYFLWLGYALYLNFGILFLSNDIWISLSMLT